MREVLICTFHRLYCAQAHSPGYGPIRGTTLEHPLGGARTAGKEEATPLQRGSGGFSRTCGGSSAPVHDDAGAGSLEVTRAGVGSFS